MQETRRLPLVEFDSSHARELQQVPESVGWKDSLEDWYTMLACGRAFGHREETGQVVSTGVLFDFGNVYTIGKMIVRPSHQRRGLATAVLEHLLAARQKDVHTSLVATDAGRPVYSQRGFEKIGMIHKLTVDGSAAERPSPFDPERDVKMWAERDARAYGADRTRLIEARMRQVISVAQKGDAYGVRMGGEVSVIGPVYARDDDSAFATIVKLAAQHPGRCRVDVPDIHADLVARLVASGFHLERSHTTMSLAGTSPPGDRSELYALASQAWG